MKLTNFKIIIVRLILLVQNSFLGFICRVLFIKPSFSQNKYPKRIVVLRSSALGDFIMAVPSMAALRRKFPNAEIKLLTLTTSTVSIRDRIKGYVGAYGVFPWISFVVPNLIDSSVCMESLHFSYIKKNISPVFVDFNPDMAVILPQQFGGSFTGTLKKLLLLRFINIRCPVYGWRLRNCKFFKRSQFESGLLDHAVISPIRAVSEIPPVQNIDEIHIEFPLEIDPSIEAWAEQCWLDYNLADKRVVAVAPGSIQPHKRWPIDKFAHLCQKLGSLSSNIYIIVIGINEDACLGEQLEFINPNRLLNLVGKTSVSQLAALLQKCSLLVGNDGGAMHLGSAMKCPTVSIIPGLEYPGSVEPWFNRNLAVRHSVSCAPCYFMTNCPENHRRCMTEISVNDVYSKCKQVLDSLCSDVRGPRD